MEGKLTTAGLIPKILEITVVFPIEQLSPLHHRVLKDEYRCMVKI